MRIPGLAREYERTCGDCGHTWRVPKWAAHPPMKGLPMGGNARTGVANSNAVVSANAGLAERADAFRRCSECGSGHYKQQAIRF